MVKKLIKYFFRKKGYKIVSAKSELNRFNNELLSNNFDNLCLNYEILFSEKYGDIPKNKNRANILKDLLGTPPSEAYFIIKSLNETNEIVGDVCEFGVAQGITSQLIANEILNDESKKIHLFDSFQGLSKPTENDILKDDIFNLGSIEAYAGKMSLPEEMVLKRLEDIQFPKGRFEIHKGFIEDLISEKKKFPEKVSFAYVDFDFYEPIKIILEYLNDVTSKGSIIIVDDYDFFSTGSKLAVDEFVANNNSKFDLYIPDKSYGYFAILTKIEE